LLEQEPLDEFLPKRVAQSDREQATYDYKPVDDAR
jgi:hypothetical protein